MLQHSIFIPIDYLSTYIKDEFDISTLWIVSLYIKVILILFVIPFMFFWYINDEDIGIVI